MDKLWLIIKREYWIRVRKKSFLIVTLLGPLAFALLMFGMGFLSAYFMEKVSMRVVVKDDSGIFKKYFEKKSDIIYDFSDQNLDSLQKNYQKDKYEILVYIPPYDNKSKEIKVKYFTKKNPGIVVISKIEKDISNAFRKYKIEISGIDKKLLESLDVDVNMEKGLVSEKSADKTGKISAAIATALSMIMGFLLYMVIFIFGSMVMRSVMEEKINRIVEVIISSVKPFYLMLGKVIGVGAVGLTQLLIWVILIPVIMVATNMILGDVSHNAMELQGQMNAADLSELPLPLVIKEFFSLNWALILPSFILFFLGGYFLYSSMFAAVGAAIGDDMGEGQSLMWPISVIIMFAMIIMINTTSNPDSPMAVFGSIFPLFSPIVMPARLPFEPPLWQVLLSLVLLILNTVFFIWVSAKIYRATILLYGKKLTYKEIMKILKHD